MSKNKKSPKVETIEEYLARGGVIKELPSEPAAHSDMIQSTIAKKPTIYTLSEGGTLFGEKRKSGRKPTGTT